MPQPKARIVPFLSLLVLATATALTAFNGTFEIVAVEQSQNIKVVNDYLQLEFAWTQPIPSNYAVGQSLWRHSGREELEYNLGTLPGRLISDTYLIPKLKLTRQIWLSQASDVVAIRQKVENRDSETMSLNALVPLMISSRGDFSLSGKRPEDCAILAQKRLKNEVPSVYFPDSAMEITADPFLILHPNGKQDGPSLLVGILSDYKFLSQVKIEFKPGDKLAEFSRLEARCDLQGLELPPGGEVASHWVYLKLDSDANQLMADYSERLADYYKIKKPLRNSPSVYCSWYYHGQNYSQKHLNEELQYFKKNPMPFDVFLIDDCWSRTWGDWLENEMWSTGMKAAADSIVAAGYQPGIWSCPTLVQSNSKLAEEHPQWLLSQRDGSPLIFEMGNLYYVLDPTYPGVCEFIEETFRRFVDQWGFTYLKLDFMRSVFIERNVTFYDRSVTSLEAYRKILEAARRGAGSEAYISVCGGHFNASLGIADSQRSGSDVRGEWTTLVPYRQNLYRTWMNRLWHVDPDAMLIRREPEPLGSGPYGNLNIGRFNDIEARTVTLNQYLGGNMVTFSEKFNKLDPDRMALYRHVIPSVNSPSIPLDPFNNPCPSRLLTKVTPRCNDLAPYVTLAVVNWTDDKQREKIVLSDNIIHSMGAKQYVVFEFFSQRLLGIYKENSTIDLGDLHPHESKLLKITPWNGKNAVLAGTDLHFSGGGVEVAGWSADSTSVTGTIESKWNYPVKVTVAFPDGDDMLERSVVVGPDQRDFEIKKFGLEGR